jgi:drug/metabolite transporter (DMT)-like permease
LILGSRQPFATSEDRDLFDSPVPHCGPRCPINRRSGLKNAIFIVLAVLSNSVGNVFLAIGMKHMPEFHASSTLIYAASLLTNRWIVIGTALLIVWMVAQLSMLTWADLTYVLPVTAAVYVVTALLSRFFLDEHVSSIRWAGVVVISCAVLLVVESSPRTQKIKDGVA